MDKDNSIQLFEDRTIRTAWDEENEEWYFSVVDVVAVLTNSENPRRYWSDLKRKLKFEGSELYEKIVQLKMKSSDGKYYKTDVADTEQLLRIIQSIPSPKAEPFKIWLAQVGRERIEETIDPEITINRALETYLKKENLRDNMSTTEIILNMLAETATKDISKQSQPETFEENRSVAKRGGRIAGNARKELEQELGQSVITSKNAVQLNEVVTNMIEGVVYAEDDETGGA
ncbi:MAG: Bro-N domain-containing protein [Oscillospiraceae bacterium]|nr:Bro-N domain-containing protein [Oscillospiraceae bacterium]